MSRDLSVHEGGARSTVLLEGRSSLELCRVRLRHRLQARARSSSLDRALADGRSPESSLILAWRASWLYQPEQRQRLAAGLRRVAATAVGPRRCAVPVCRGAIGDTLDDIEALVARLTGSGPVSVHGVAKVQVLLTDGTGPLFQRKTSADQLRRTFRSALLALEPQP